MAKMERKLPNHNISKTGRDCYSSQKKVTVVMAPFERFSAFPKALDELYLSVDIPFNLIVVEGHAPESIRAAIDSWIRWRPNATVLYSQTLLSLAAAFNLAVPHIQTPYALFLDNDVRLRPGSLEKMLECAEEKKAPVVFPGHSVLPRRVQVKALNDDLYVEEIRAPGIRPCFLFDREALSRFGKFDEDLNAIDTGLDLYRRFHVRGLSMETESDAAVECDPASTIRELDMELYARQWGSDTSERSRLRLAEKWGVRSLEVAYERWLESKQKKIEVSAHEEIGEYLNHLSLRAMLLRSSVVRFFSLPKGVGL